ATMPRQKIDLPVMQSPAGDDVRRPAKWRFQVELDRRSQPFDLIQAAAADDADIRFFHAAEIKQTVLRDEKLINTASPQNTGCIPAARRTRSRNVLPD